MNLRYASLVAACSLCAGCPSGHVLYAGQATSGPAGFEIWDIKVKDGAPAGSPVNLTQSAGDDVDADWNQPKGKIAFASDRSGTFEIYSMDPDGSNVSPLTNNTAMDRFPSWEPNGDRMVYASDQSGNFEIMRMYASGSNPGQLTNNSCLDTEPAWSPDGARIVFVSNCAGGSDLEIFVMDANGGGITQLTTRPTKDDFHPTWSPDGTRIAFESVPTGGSAHVNTEILIMDANGSNLQPISTAVPPTGDLIHPAWSSDGNFIAVGMTDSSGDYNIYTVNLTNGGLRIVVDQPATQWSPAWGDPSN